MYWLRHRGSAVLDRIRDLAYTGDNRCPPCIGANAVFAVTLVGVVAWVGSPFLGAASPAASIAVIGLRECPIPGTPTLTQRYLPSWAMAYFEHGSAQTALDSHPEPTDMDDRDRDNISAEHGVSVPCDGGADLCLMDAIRHAWTDALDTIGADVDAAPSGSAFVNAESSEFVIDESIGDLAVSVDGAHASWWPSREALPVDVTGTIVLTNELPGWHGLSSRTRGIALSELRLFLDRCPTCGGDPDLQRRTEATCCQVRPVTMMRCADCDASFVEVVET